MAEPVKASPEAESRGRSRLGLRPLGRDFLLIVVGVLTALMLENWNATRVERKLEREYLEALAEDVRAHVSQYDDWLNTLARHRTWTDTVWQWASGTQPVQPKDQVLLWMRLGGQINLSTRLQDGAYQDLVNSGRLSLIRNRVLREALVTYDNDRMRWASIIEASGSSAADKYGVSTAGVIPAEIAWAMATGADVSTVELAPILRDFRSRPQVRQALAAMAESHRFRSGAAENRKRRAAELLAQLERELGR